MTRTRIAANACLPSLAPTLGDFSGAPGACNRPHPLGQAGASGKSYVREVTRLGIAESRSPPHH